MLVSTLLAASLQAAAPAAAPPTAEPPAAERAPALTLDQRTALRCAAAFALGAEAQARGDPQAMDLPPLAERGREYFVRLSAGIMDETGLPRDAVAQVLADEARALVRTGQRHAAVPPCLVLLDASGL